MTKPIPDPDELFTDEDFVVNEFLPSSLAEHLTPAYAVQALDLWHRRMIEAVDDVVHRYKYQAVADKD